ncbi:MAG: hypothetical protein IPG08_17025 [Sphingobacteriaceae bacterium]|nr:hypothetical protein [Sphingobacteriaceae bacterium]
MKPLSKVVDYNDSPDLIFDRPWLTIDNSGGPYNGYLYMAKEWSYKSDPLPHHVFNAFNRWWHNLGHAFISR